MEGKSIEELLANHSDNALFTTTVAVMQSLLVLEYFLQTARQQAI